VKRKTKIGCLAVLGILTLLCLVLVGVGYWALKKAANSISMDAIPLASESTDSPASTKPAPKTGWEMVKKALSDGGTTVGSVLKGDLRFQIPDGLWQSEVRNMFPMEESISDLVAVSIRNPSFMRDADPKWLRLNLDLTARVLDGDPLQFPGRLTIRAQIKLLKDKQTVILSRAELAEFSFSGEASAVAEGLRDVLAESIQAELEGFEVFRFPEGGEWWMESGKGMVKDVVVENGGIVVIAGW
jgi:hypothetical protein